MSRRTDRSYHGDDLNIFQAFTDLMSNAFMIISFLLLISLLQSVSISKKLESAAPIIIKEKSGNFKFPSGSAELTPDLQKYIQNSVKPGINKAIEKGNIDFIQVIGHTDSQGIGSAGNLDNKLILAATSKEKVSTLKAGSNADLGLMRALAVVQFLQQTKELNNIKFRAYSAAQLYPPSETSGESAPVTLGADDARRRRIEIRFIPHGQTK
jgi:outer membrane protein OmpA-like peptidoglycan-associated protein